MKKLFVIMLVILISAGLLAESKMIPVNSSGFDTGQYEYRRTKSNEIPVNLRTRSEAYFKAGEYADYFYGTFDTATPGDMTEILSPPAWNSYSGDFDNVNTDFFFMNNPDDFNIYTVDCATGAQTLVGPTGLSESLNGMACNKQTGVMYACTSNNLYTIDLTTGTAVLVGPIGNGAGLMLVLACDGTDLWGIDLQTDDLWQIDSATGAGTSIGATGFDCNYAQSMTWDPLSGDIYWAAYGGGLNGNLRLVDTATGNSTLIGDFEGGREVTVFAIPGGGAPELAPSFPTGVTVTPDAGGALTADIDWTCPTLDVGGNTLTDLDEMRVYRDGNLIYTDTAPVIGDPGNYPDVVPASGNYTYSVVGFNDAGEGLPANVVSWVGEDVPNGVTDLMLEDLSTETDLIAYLSWVNPTTGLNGGPFNEPILGYHIVRSDMTEFELTGVLTEWTDDTITVIDYYSYSITAYNSIGDGATVISNTSLITTANIMFADDFSGGLANWEIVNNGGTADWMIIEAPYENTYLMPGTSLPPVCSADTDLAGIGSTMDSELILATPLDCSEMIDVILDFDSDYNAINADDFGYVDISVNGGVDWTNVLTYNVDDVPATHVMLNISPVVAGFSEVLIRFHSVQPGWHWWWTIDNVMVSGTEGELGAIVGTVIDAVTTDPIEGAIVTFSGTTQTTDAAGYYEFATTFPGTYTLTCEADGYYDGAEESIVLSGETTTTDFAMNPFEFATLDGTVTDDDSGVPIEGATISMVSDLGYSYETTSIADGTYSIVDIVADIYDITCIASMYIPQTIMDITFDPAAAITQDFDLGLSISYFSDFEDNDGYLLSSDPLCWQWGAPIAGPGVAYSGNNVWGTELDTTYPNDSNATLDTTIPVGIVTSAYILEFWHWYDIEADYDGGNVKVSIDNGATWSVLTPNTPYPGTANTSNPLTGEPIYTGASAGWELAQFDLAAYVGENILIRWHFGSDGSVPYPGWYIDDVAIYEQEFGSIEGVVSEFGTGDVIENAEVTAGPYSAVSGADGSYVINGVVTGTYTIECEHALYLPLTIEDVSVEAGTATIQDISMLWAEIAVDVTELNSVLAEDVTETQTFVITNDGPGDLEYSIGFDFPADVRMRQVSNDKKVQTSRTTSSQTTPLVTKKTDNNRETVGNNLTGLAPRQFFNPSANEPNINENPFRDPEYQVYAFNAYDPSSAVPVGPVTFVLNDPAGLTSLSTAATDFIAGATMIEDTWIGCESVTGNFYTIDFDGTMTLIGGNGTACNGLAYDDNSGILYGATYGTASDLYTIDPATGEGTLVGNINAGIIIAMGCDNAGNLYGVDLVDNSLYSIDPSTGAGTVIGPLGIVINYAQDAEYDKDDEVFYLSAYTAAGELYTCDTTTGATTLIGAFPGGMEVTGFAIPYTRESWVSITNNASGTVLGNGGSVTVTVTFDATDLLEGDVLIADLVINNNAGDDVILPVSLTVTSTDAEVNLPVLHTKLNNNYPNPFNPDTNIAYSIKNAGKVSLEVYNVKGQLVKILVNERKEIGNYVVTWNGKDNSRKPVASGVYFYKMKTQNYNSTKKMILMK